MKKSKLVIVFSFILMITAVLNAVNDNSNSTSKRADLMIEKMSKDIQLTDSQRVVLKTSAKAMFVKRDEADKKAANNEGIDQKRTAFTEYELVLNAVLTTVQKDSLQIKQNERRQSVENKFK